MSNTFDPTKVNKLAADAERKELLRTVTDAVNLHDKKERLKKISDGRKLARDLDDIDFGMDFVEVARQAKDDVDQRNHAIKFMYDELSGFVQLAPGSLALICAATGTGKSTFTANIAYALMRDGKRTLIVANEEKKTDVAARISCLQLDVNIHQYKHKDGLPDIIYQNVLDNIATFTGNLSIVGTDYKNNSMVVTSHEGVEKLLRGAYGLFDCVIIDYYQNINNSLNNPGYQAHESNAAFARCIDVIKNEIGCPIIMMAQIRRGDEDMKVRLEGSRLILNKCTDIFEVKIDKPNSRSMLICHKDRWLGNQGEERFIAYKGGKFLPYSKDFEDNIKSAKVSVIDALASDP